MFTRARLVAVAIVTTVLVVLPTATPEDATASAAPPGEPPNIVLITTDDQALSDLLWMPRTRELIGRQGFTFTQGLAPAPLCCPARAQLLTGQYSHNNGVRNNSGRHGGYDSLVDPGNTLASWLQDAGYRTGMVGKFLNGWSPGRHGVTPGWTHFNPASAGIFSGYGSTMFQHGQPQRYDDQHSNDVVTLSTMDLIDQWSEEAPFFVWTSFAAPHGTCSDTAPLCDAPPIPADRHRSAFANVTNVAEAKPSFNERDVSDKPAAVRNLKKVSRSKMQKLFTQRLRSLASVDEGVGAIVDKLREAGELDNTLIVFTSDNGYLTGEHRHSGKVLPFWESLRVPLLMRGPGIKPGRSSGCLRPWSTCRRPWREPPVSLPADARTAST